MQEQKRKRGDDEHENPISSSNEQEDACAFPARLLVTKRQNPKHELQSGQFLITETPSKDRRRRVYVNSP